MRASGALGPIKSRCVVPSGRVSVGSKTVDSYKYMLMIDSSIIVVSVAFGIVDATYYQIEIYILDEKIYCLCW